MELSQIRYFLEVAKTQHVTRSAEKLHIAQPALTQAIHRLEKDLGVPLFVSKGRNIVLTEYGRYLQKRLEPLVNEWDSIPDELRTMAKLEGETIHLNVQAASAMIIEAVIEYKAAHKDLNFQFIQSASNDIFDIAVTTQPNYQNSNDDSEMEFSFREKLFLAVPNEASYSAKNSINLSDVRNEGFISLQSTSRLRWICDKYCQMAGFEPRVAFESDNPATVRNMIAANMGVGFWPEFSWGKVAGEQVRLLEIDYPTCHRDIVVTCKHNKIDNARVDGFFAFLKQFMQKKMKQS